MDIRLRYREKGSGEPLILLHGNGEDGSGFVHQMEYFSRRYRVIAPDTRGHGESPRGTAPFTIAQFARDLSDFLTELEIPRAALLGFSDGANIAMDFALEHPERVSALILNGGNLDPGGIKLSAQIPIEIGYRAARLFSRLSPKAKRNAELLGLMVNDPMIPPEALERIAAPTLVICGTRDLIREEHSREIARRIPGARFSLIEGDHFIAYKNPEAFNAEAGRFLEEVFREEARPGRQGGNP